jgi:hypothetical protein
VVVGGESYSLRMNERGNRASFKTCSLICPPRATPEAAQEQRERPARAREVRQHTLATESGRRECSPYVTVSRYTVASPDMSVQLWMSCTIAVWERGLAERGPMCPPAYSTRVSHAAERWVGIMGTHSTAEGRSRGVPQTRSRGSDSRPGQRTPPTRSHIAGPAPREARWVTCKAAAAQGLLPDPEPAPASAVASS